MRQDSPVLGKLFNKNIFNLEFLFFFSMTRKLKQQLLKMHCTMYVLMIHV